MAGYIGNKLRISGSYTVDEFTSSGGTTYTLSKTPGAKNNIQVSAGGLTQYPSAYSVSGTTLTLSGVPSGQKVVVRHMGDTIPYPALDDDAVTSAKIANDAVTGAKLNPALVAGDVIYADGTDTINRLAKGTAAQVLTMNAGATAPEWTAAAGGGDLRNFIIDGDFTQWPAGTSISCPINTNTYGGGLWRVMSSNSAAVVSVVRGTDVPTVAQSNHQSAYSLDIDYTTADSALGSHDILGVDYVVTGSDYAHLHNAQQVTLAFWIKATVTGTSCVYFINSGYNRSYVAEFTISSTNTWEYKTITLTTDNTGTWLFTKDDKGLIVGFALSHIGSTYHATNETWTGTAQKHSTSSQVNHASSTSNIFRISQIGLYKGSSAPSPFLGESTSVLVNQLAYYVKPIYSGEVTHNVNTTMSDMAISHNPPMRVAPSYTHKDTTGTAWEGNAAGAQVQSSGTGVLNTNITNTQYGSTIFTAAWVGLTGGKAMQINNAYTLFGLLDARH